MVVRFLVWSLLESRTTLDELRDALPPLEPPSTWIWNEAVERFGVIVYGEELPEVVGWAQDLIGAEPDIYEEWDS